MKSTSGFVAFWMVVAATGLLVACGGGSDDAPSPPAPPPASAALALSGTAATGAAIAGAAVDVVCSSGTASGTTGSDGGYSLSVTGGSLPCVLRVNSGGSQLYSLVLGAGSSASANITPLTQLLLAYLAGAEPAAFYAGFNSTVAASVTAPKLTSAQAWVVALLGSAGIDLTSTGDLISAPLSPRTSGSAGNAYAQALDQLAGVLTSAGTSLPSLTTAVAIIGGAPGDGTDSLPPEMLLQPVASTCSSLHSGSYRVVSPTAHSTLANQFSTMTINAATLAVNRSDVGAATWSANGNCRFTGAGGLTDALVSSAGVIVMHYAASAGASYRWAIAFPEQSHTLAELAGNWNMMGIAANATATGFTGMTASATVDAAGAQTAVTRCQNDATWSVKAADCSTPAGPAQSFVADSAGGFDLVNAGTVGGRAFAYRSGSGDLMVAEVQADGSFQLRTRQSSTTLPQVGRFISGFDMYVQSTLASPGDFDPYANTIVSVDAAAKSWVRVTANGGSMVTHHDTLFGDNPRSGYNFRAAGTATASDGSTVRISEYTLMPLAGMGLAPLLLPGSKLFDLSTGWEKSVSAPPPPPTGGGVAACSPLSLPIGSTVQAVLFNAAVPMLGGTFTQTSNGPVQFEGHNAIELHLTAPVIGVALDAKVYLSIDGTGAMTEYGQHAVISTSAGSSDTYTVLTPPVVDREFTLSPGESTPSLTVTQVDTTINTINGVASPPVTQTTTHTIAPKTFVGIENVTVPAGTFSTCRFTEPQTSNGVTTTLTRWLLVGYGGVEVKNSQGSTATSVLFNGVPLTSN